MSSAVSVTRPLLRIRRSSPFGSISSRSCYRVGSHALGAIPGNGVFQALIEGRTRAEAKLALGAADVETAARLAVGFGGVPAQLALETDQRGDFFGQFADADLHAAAQIARLAAVIVGRSQRNAFGGVLDMQELARGAAVAPQHDVVDALFLRLNHLSDQRRNDVRSF